MRIIEMMRLLRNPRYVSRVPEQVTSMEEGDQKLAQGNMYQQPPAQGGAVNPKALDAVAQGMYDTDMTKQTADERKSPTPWGKKMQFLQQQGMQQKLNRPSLAQNKKPFTEGMEDYGFDQL